MNENRPIDGEKKNGLKAKPLSDAARRALAEAEFRRNVEKNTQIVQPELGGRIGPEPVRYGDWEVKGLASDF
jgi:hypothetical protein